MNSPLERYKNVHCKLLTKEDNEQFAQVHFGVITFIDYDQKKILFDNGEKEHHIAFENISALRKI